MLALLTHAPPDDATFTDVPRFKGRHMIDRDAFNAMPAMLEVLWLRVGAIQGTCSHLFRNR